jgi:beta-glucanase (GH16 family)
VKRFITLIALSVVGLSGSLSAHAATLPSAVISFTTPSKAVYGDPDKQLTITQNAGVTTVISTTPAVCSVSIDLKVKVLAVGVCRLSASNPGTANYKAARPISKSFVISKAPNYISIADFNWLSMAHREAEISTSETAGTTVLKSLTKTVCTVVGQKVYAIKIGKCTLSASNSGSANYLAAKSVTKTVAIGATSTVLPPAPFVGPWTVRQHTFTDANSVSDTASASDWVSNGWYKAGLKFRVAQLPVLSTVTMRYLVTDSTGRPTPNKNVNLSVGKRYAGSNAKVKVGTQSTAGVDKSPADQLLVSATTNSFGIATFEITGLDTTARNGLYTQIAAWVTDLSQDVIDITNLEYSLPAGTGGVTTDPTLVNPNKAIDSLFYQPCTGVTLFGQIANIDVDPVGKADTVLAVSRGRSDAPSGIWDYSVLATLNKGTFVSAGNKQVSVQVYSPIAGLKILLRAQNARGSYTKYVQTQAFTTKVNQWETLVFDFASLAAGSQGLDLTVNYSTLALLVDAGNSSRGIKLYFKNFMMPGALIPSDALSTKSTEPNLSAKAGPMGEYLWAEEFNGPAKSRPHSDSWKYALDWNNFIQGTQPDLVELDGSGNLAIGMQKCADGSWNGGIIHTLGKTAFLYGKIEARIKLANDPGWFSAFYMFGEDVAHWPTCGEIDVQEAGPWNDFSSSGTIHGNNPGSTTSSWNNGSGLSTKVPYSRTQLASQFHTYGVLWTPNSITFTLDGVTYRHFTKEQVLKDVGTWPFDVPEFIVYSIYPYTASLPASTPAGTVLRGQVLVDWIRYSSYQGYGQVLDR